MKNYFLVTTITANPFDNKHIKKIILNTIGQLQKGREHLKVRICDPFSNKQTKRIQGTSLITNDLNPKFNATYNLEFNDFGEFAKDQNFEFDLILFDPPYSLSQLKRQYEGIGQLLPQWQCRRMWTRGKDALAKCVRPGGIVISLGWNSQGWGKHRGFEKVALYNFEQSGREGQYNIQLVIEKKIQHSITDY